MLSFGNTSRCRLSTSIRQGAVAVTSLVAGIAIGTMIPGCGGGAPQKPTQAESSPQPKSAPKVERVAADDHVEKGRPKRKESEIPLDVVWFDNPLEVAQNSAVAAGANPAAPGPAVAANDDMKPEVAAPPKASGGAAWGDYISVDMLQDEVKRIRNRLTSHLGAVGTYNGNYKDIAFEGAVMAALAGIVIENGSDVNWKANAPYIRNFGYDLSQAASGLGKDNYDKSKTAFEKMQSVFSGTVPPDAAKPEPKRPFGDVASRSGLMKRIEKAKNWMKDNIVNDAKLKSETDSILHEAALISTLGKVVTTEGYVSAEEPEYQQFAKLLIEGAQEATGAVKDQNLKKFKDAMDKVNKSCADCHANYGK